MNSVCENFKNNVLKVAFEINSNCNRKCYYCPQSLIDIRPQKMDTEILDKVLIELKHIKYDKNICLNIFNEPLFYYDNLINSIIKIKNSLTDTYLYFSTNGDFLTRERPTES